MTISKFIYIKFFYLISATKFAHDLLGKTKNFIPFSAHLCSYSTFQFCAFARLFHQGRSGPIAFQT